MNVYDFDGTIYRGDSSIDFFRFIIRKKPATIKRLPGIIKGSLQYAFGKIDKKAFKERFFSFLDMIDGEAYAERFWNEHPDRICNWYRMQQQEDDVVISASPEFLLAPACRKLGIRNLIASDVDIRTGKFRSDNCKGEEKVRRFREKYPDEKIERFYSDSESDLPLAKEAEKAFMIRNGIIREWNYAGKQ